MRESEIIFDIIKKRRSVRRFADKKIPSKELEQILESARWAPSGANTQPWRFVVITKKETLAAISESCYYKVLKSHHVAEASAVVILCADQGTSPTYIQDTTIAGTNMVLMATALGVGSCWIGGFDETTLKKVLQIPDKLKLIALIAFGYEVTPPSIPPRLPLSTLVHWENYNSNNEPGTITRIRKSGPLSVIGKVLGVLFNRR